MRIPLGNLGNRTPGIPNIPEGAFDTGIGAALQTMGKALGGMVDDDIKAQMEQRRELDKEARQQQRQLEAEDRARQRELKRIESLNAHGASINGLEDLLADVDGKIKGGELGRDKAEEYFRQKAQGLQVEALKGVDPDNQPLIRAQMDQDLGRYRRKVVDTVRKHEESALAGGVAGWVESMKRYASTGEAQRITAERNVATYLESTGQLAGMTPENIQKTQQAFREEVQTNAATNLVGNDPHKGLQALKNGAYEALEPKVRLSLIQSAQNELERIQRKQEARSDKWLRGLEEQMGTARDIMERGGVISPALRADLDKATKGTSLASAWDNLKQEYDGERKYRLMRPAEKQAQMNEFNARLAQHGVSDDRILKDRDRLEKLIGAEKEALRTDGYSYAVRQGVVDHVPVNLGEVLLNPASMQPRMDQADVASAHYGVAVSPLSAEEAEALGGAISRQTDSEQAATAKRMVQALGPGRAGAIFRQIQVKDPTFAAAGMLSAAGARTNMKRDPAELILRGRRLIEGKQVQMPPDQQARNAFNAAVGSAISTNSGRETAYRSAAQVYATLMHEDGKVDRKELDADTFRRAIRLVTGEIVDFGDYQVLPPRYGVSASQARDMLKSIKPQNVKAWGGVQGMTDDMAAAYINDDETALESVGLGRYRVKSGTGYLKRLDGKPFEMIFR